MDIKDIKEIYRFIKATDIVEIELEDSRGKVRLKRKGAETALPQTEAKEPQEAKKETLDEGEKKSNIKTLSAPMVGTFYRAPSSDGPPFIELGNFVKSGQIVCIIEAMKIMNEVESEFTGKIVSILVENGQPVEYGEPLFHIEA